MGIVLEAGAPAETHVGAGASEKSAKTAAAEAAVAALATLPAFRTKNAKAALKVRRLCKGGYCAMPLFKHTR